MAKKYSKAQLESYLNNANVRKMLDLISAAEGTTRHGYYTTFGGGRQSSLARHENRQRSFTQTDGKKNSSGAAGRYGFLKSTWDSLARQYGLNDFGERNQDIGALALIAQKGQLENVASGNFTAAVKGLGSIWASFPSSPYPQPRRSWDWVNKFLGNASGTSSAPEATNTSGVTATSVTLPTPQTATPSAVTAPDPNQVFGSGTQSLGLPLLAPMTVQGLLTPMNAPTQPSVGNLFAPTYNG